MTGAGANGNRTSFSDTFDGGTHTDGLYALFPDTNVSIHVLWGLKQQNTVLACGKSILNRSSKTDIGPLMLQYGGGGHQAAGTCQVDNDRAEEVLEAIVARMRADG